MERKDLLMQEAPPKRPVILEEGKLAGVVDEAAALAAMKETRGWRILQRKFIEPRITIERIFSARGPFKRAEAIAAVRELDLLIKFVNGQIEEGQKANEQLETLRKK
jgi:hypothetical protein